MIELKPYRATVTTSSGKDKKLRVGGQVQTGNEAVHPWYEGPVTSMSSCAFIGMMGIGIFVIIGYLFGAGYLVNLSFG